MKTSATRASPHWLDMDLLMMQHLGDVAEPHPQHPVPQAVNDQTMETTKVTPKAPWITYRPAIKVLDCTLRDGGLVNAHHFSDEFILAIYHAAIAAGIDYLEVGYKNSDKVFEREKYGALRFCDEAELNRLFKGHDAQASGLKLAAMADAGKSEWQTKIVPAEESTLSMIRVAFYAHQVSEAVEMLHHAHDLGYETMANMMAVSSITEEELDTVLEAIAKTPAGTMVIVDSFGCLYREQIERLYHRYSSMLVGTDKEIGMHAHNNLQLAFSNTIDAIVMGCNRVDSTMMGLGRGAGNCHTELLLGFLRNPKFDLRPIVEFIQNYVLPLRGELNWGPSLPYNLTGQLKQHPRDAIEWLASERHDDYLAFYDKMIKEDTD